MVFRIGIDNCNDSNLFLRALSGKFETELGKCAWNYAPFKARKGTCIFLGFMDINLHKAFSVYIHYKVKGCIESLEIKSMEDKEVEGEFQKLISDIVSETMKSYKTGKKKVFRFNVESFVSFSKYSSEMFDINFVSDNISSISCCIECYGKNDGMYMLQIKRARFLDMLSILTNLPFYECELKENHEDTGEEIYYLEDNFIEGYPCNDKYVLLPTYGKVILEKIMKYSKEIDDEDIEKLLNAAKHFHAGRKFDAQINDLINLKVIDTGDMIFEERNITSVTGVCDCIFEMAVVSYISALEVLAGIMYPDEGKKCEYCGQTRYSISARVKKLLFRYLDKGLAKIIHSFYSSRSKFLHVGRSLKSIYTGMTIPQLDKNSQSGMEMHQDISIILLREYVGYCARCIIREKILNDDSVIIYKVDSDKS